VSIGPATFRRTIRCDTPQLRRSAALLVTAALLIGIFVVVRATARGWVSLSTLGGGAVALVLLACLVRAAQRRQFTQATRRPATGSAASSASSRQTWTSGSWNDATKSDADHIHPRVRQRRAAAPSREHRPLGGPPRPMVTAHLLQ